MTKTIVFANQKGGVGKTTIMTHAAHYGRELPAKVLLVDLDPQENATSIFFDGESAGCLVASDLFAEGGEVGTIKMISDRIGLIPADVGLVDAGRLPVQAAVTFRNALARIADEQGFDLVLIDTPPTLGLGMVAALAAADAVVSPIEPAAFAINGVQKLVGTIQEVQQSINPKMRFLGLLINRWNTRSKKQQEALDALREQLPQLVIPHAIGHHAAIADASEVGEPVWLRPNGAAARKAAREMRGAMEWLFSTMGLLKEEERA